MKPTVTISVRPEYWERWEETRKLAREMGVSQSEIVMHLLEKNLERTRTPEGRVELYK